MVHFIHLLPTFLALLQGRIYCGWFLCLASAAPMCFSSAHTGKGRSVKSHSHVVLFNKVAVSRMWLLK